MAEKPAINAMIEMTNLFVHRPSLNAPVEAVVEWYQAKGRMHERLAARGDADAAKEAAYAAASFAHAHRLQYETANASTDNARWAA
jgi:hypothetical protein